ncbi:MAG: molybdenum cofactor biosynthesis protein MoaE [Verrucomicrobia bacterium]|nr:molybdenum cofactor biosynthesis protein MoaE [Verrucomicrobiota bacterium]
MKRFLSITRDPIDEAGLVAGRTLSSGMGAAVYFSGVVRGQEGADAIVALDYSCFIPMAEHQFQRLFDRLAQRGSVESVRLVHRIGRVPVGESSLWIEVVSAHRAEAFAACQWVIDEMKQVVPIWKKPVTAADASISSDPNPSS